jgi:hydrogenase-4 component E
MSAGVGMSAMTAAVLVGLGIGVLVVRRRAVAVGLVTAQSLVLVGLAVAAAVDADELLAAAALAARSVALAALFWFVIVRTRESRPVTSGLSPLRRGGLGIALALALTWLVPHVGLDSRDAERAVLAVLALGLMVAATRRETLFGVLGVILVENSLVLAALRLPGSSWLIEVGVALDLTLLALVAAAFHARIFAEFGAGDTEALRSLRD